MDDLDPRRALANLAQEMTGDWYRDPWNWPEYDFLHSTDGKELIRSRIASNALAGPPSEIDVPKENFGVRPAVILSISDRVIYQTLVDALSSALIGSLLPEVYGWRLPAARIKKGHYARQDFQWTRYRSKLSRMADEFDFGLKTDVSAFFSSLDPDVVAGKVLDHRVHTKTAERLCRMLSAWKVHNPRPGLPQRSTASSVLANMMLTDADAVLRSAAQPDPRSGKRFSFSRWMDDMWIFGDDEGLLRGAQIDLQQALRPLGLVLNSAKTALLSDNELSEATKKIQASVIDDALEGSPTEHKPLEALIDQVFEEKESIDRSTVRFISTRMRDHNIGYRMSELLEISVRLPHAADHLGRLFRRRVPSTTMQDWLADYVKSSWSRFEWSTAQFAIAIKPTRLPRKATRELFKSFLMQNELSVPLAAVSAQRLAQWEPASVLEIIEQRITNEPSPQITRVLCLAALQAGAKPNQVRKWLAFHDENYLTLLALEWRSFGPIRVSRDYR